MNQTTEWRMNLINQESQIHPEVGLTTKTAPVPAQPVPVLPNTNDLVDHAGVTYVFRIGNRPSRSRPHQPLSLQAHFSLAKRSESCCCHPCSGRTERAEWAGLAR